MAILSANDITIRFGDPPLFENLSFHLEEKERVCLLGRNGAGKSTLMKLLASAAQPKEGSISIKPNVRVAYLPQEVPQGLSGRVFDLAKSGLADVDTAAMDDWKKDEHVGYVLSQLQLDGGQEVSELSAGWKRRALLGRELAKKPDVLLLDEPTNHLDIEAIVWMETFLLRFAGSILFVTHDRMFLQKLATRIVEIDRGALYNWECDYKTYLLRKEEALETEANHAHKLDRKLSQEEAWLRRSPKARRTRNEGRVRALQKLRDERRKRPGQTGNVTLKAHLGETSGDLAIEVNELSFGYEGNPIVKDFSTRIMRGDKIGVIGPNGSGKTTLLKLLLNQLQPTQGAVRHGSKLEIAYFDQLRDTLDEEKSVVENVGGGTDLISINGQTRHIIGYLGDFLFSPERARSPVKILSGGERNRALLAKMLTYPANLLVLDEPTNDLDAETLELLENLLVEFSGTILLVSHDRAFLNNVAASLIALDGDGNADEFIGGYDDWLAQRKQAAIERKERRNQRQNAKRPEGAPSGDAPKKLSYGEKMQIKKDHQELRGLPETIERLEREQAAIHEAMSDPAFFKQPHDTILKTQNQLKQLEDGLRDTFQRWEELEDFFAGFDMKRL